MQAEVVDKPGASRFEMIVEGQLAFVSYTMSGGRLLLTHAEVPSALSGQGLGSKLAAGVYALIRERGERAVPLCSFMVWYARRHPEVADVVDM